MRSECVHGERSKSKRPFGDGQTQERLLSDKTILNASAVTFPPKPTISEQAKVSSRTRRASSCLACCAARTRARCCSMIARPASWH